MTLFKVKSHLIFSKEYVLDLILINYLLELGLTSSYESTNHFVSLKSPFHYKLGKNHLNIESIEVTYCTISRKFTIPDTPVLGLAESSYFFKKINYNL